MYRVCTYVHVNQIGQYATLVLPVHLDKPLHFTVVAVAVANELSSYGNLFSFETAAIYCGSRS